MNISKTGCNVQRVQRMGYSFVPTSGPVGDEIEYNDYRL